uniref:Amine oxidase domain-containing protein n=1 Tax=Romanomermis culicivorax TaxID=13658 RepID=A0A915KRH2_ROMCU
MIKSDLKGISPLTQRLLAIDTYWKLEGMQENLIRDKQLCHFRTLCSIQDRMISVLHKLEEAWRLFEDITRYLGALEATLDQQEQMQPSDVYLNQKDRRMLDWHFANLEFANAATLDQLSLKNWDQDDVHEFGGFHSIVESTRKLLIIVND